MTDRQAILEKFEQGLNPQAPEKSAIKAEVKGYGEISSIFAVQGIDGWVFKRLPLFADRASAQTYADNYRTYVSKLQEAGLNLPPDSLDIIGANPVTLYVGQQEIDSGRFGHKLLHTLPPSEALELIGQIFAAIKKVWQYNQTHKPAIELSIDGQVSNWAYYDDKLWYIDTSTPLFKIDGREQLDPELLLNSTPGALRWIIRLFFLKDVMERYYDIRLVYIDLVANLYKEQKPDLIDPALQLANKHLPEEMAPITRKEIDAYYKEDKLIWQLFLFFRKIDRWFTNKVLRRKYQFILPGKIKR